MLIQDIPFEELRHELNLKDVIGFIFSRKMLPAIAHIFKTNQNRSLRTFPN